MKQIKINSLFTLRKQTFLLAFMVFSFVFSEAAYGQQKAISGNVTDQTGTPLIGVTILESNTQNGASTDFDGNYTISVSENSELTFSYIGYLTQKIIVGTQTTIDVVLVEDLQSLDEVVVVGYGTQKKSDVTGAVGQVKDSVVDIKYFMRWIESDNERTFYDLDEDGIPEKVLPTTKIRIPVDRDAVLRNGTVAEKDAHLIEPYIDITISRTLSKNRILMLDILANNKWEKPIYFTGGAQADEEYIWLKDYLQLDGMAYRFVPIKTPNQGNFFEMGRINTDIMYKNVKNWDWRNITDDDIYLDVETRKNSVSYRNNMERLARTLISENKLEKAEEILDIAIEKMPVNKFGHYSMVISYIDLYYALDKNEKARKLISELNTVLQEKLTYYSQFDESYFNGIESELERNLLMYDQIVRTTIRFDEEDYATSIKDEYVSYLKLFDFLMEEDQE